MSLSVDVVNGGLRCDDCDDLRAKLAETNARVTELEEALRSVLATWECVRCGTSLLVAEYGSPHCYDCILHDDVEIPLAAAVDRARLALAGTEGGEKG